jgi:hypothetical protein
LIRHFWENLSTGQARLDLSVWHLGLLPFFLARAYTRLLHLSPLRLRIHLLSPVESGHTSTARSAIRAFVWKPRRFVLAQTEGEAVEMPQIPAWDKETALANLQITRIEFK